VLLRQVDGGWSLTPEGRQGNTLQLWRSYAREEIPPLYGMEFSTAIWNVGYVARSNHIFLLVTLDKSGHGTDFQYGDHFIDPSTFEWQSQNRTSREGKDGRLIRDIRRLPALRLCFDRRNSALRGRRERQADTDSHRQRRLCGRA
jgi:hypothetical protein